MKKDIKFSTRMASADREKIRALAAKAHMSMSDYVTAAEVAHRDAEIADRDEQAAGTGWEFEREAFLQVDRLVPGLQPAGGPQVDHAGADPWHGGTGGLVWRGGDPRPVPLIPAVAGLTAVGTLLDEDEDAEEKRRRMEAKIAAENFGAAIGFAAGAAMTVKEKLDEHAMREEQKNKFCRGGLF